jgi:hypothetical protein
VGRRANQRSDDDGEPRQLDPYFPDFCAGSIDWFHAAPLA